MPPPLSRPELPSSNRPRGRRIDVNNWNCPVIQMFCLLFLMSDMHWWFSIQKYILVSTPGEKKKERIDVVNCMKRTLEKIKYIYFINKYWFYDEVAEWLRRWTANPLGSARVGSNPILVEIFYFPVFLQYSIKTIRMTYQLLYINYSVK